MHESLSDEALKELYIRGGMTDWGYEALVKEMHERGFPSRFGRAIDACGGASL